MRLDRTPGGGCGKDMMPNLEIRAALPGSETREFYHGDDHIQSSFQLREQRSVVPVRRLPLAGSGRGAGKVFRRCPFEYQARLIGQPLVIDAGVGPGRVASRRLGRSMRSTTPRRLSHSPLLGPHCVLLI
jgi:hypothetical protein